MRRDRRTGTFSETVTLEAGEMLVSRIRTWDLLFVITFLRFFLRRHWLQRIRQAFEIIANLRHQ